MITLILEDIKNSIGILPDNLAFDNELLGHIESVKSSLLQLGVDELNIPIDEETEWPSFVNTIIGNLSKHYIRIRVKVLFDPVASETINKTFSDAIKELEGRILHEVSEATI